MDRMVGPFIYEFSLYVYVMSFKIDVHIITVYHELITHTNRNIEYL